MQVLMISGSRRGADRDSAGKTERIGEALLQGVESAGGQVERLFLPELRIERCRQCNPDGWGRCRTEGRCIIEDDLERVIEQVRCADAAIFCTPVYYGDISESMRALLDRLRRVANHAADHRGIAGKPAIGATVAGGSGNGSVTAAVSLERALVVCGFQILDMLPIRAQNLLCKIEVLSVVGRWLAGIVDARQPERTLAQSSSTRRPSSAER